jgi:hypothetical protein
VIVIVPGNACLGLDQIGHVEDVLIAERADFLVERGLAIGPDDGFFGEAHQISIRATNGCVKPGARRA